MGFSHRQVATLLGSTDPSMISHYEHNRAMPSLQTALGLEIILRTPVAFLFPDLYNSLKADIREKEDESAAQSHQYRS